jgi:hypothetical protein
MEIEQDKLATFRQQIAEENAEPRGKMSEAALAKLRTIREQDKLAAIDADRFKNALSSIEPTPENLKRLIERCSCRPKTRRFDKDHIDRRVAKLGWWIAAGYRLGHEIDTVSLIHFFSDLVLDEKTMSDREFAATWNAATAAKRLKSRIERGVASVISEKPPERLCKAGAKCLWAKRRQPAPAAEGSSYCTPNCQKGLAARNRRQKASQKVVNAPTPAGNASEPRVNIG